jgi:hypothetical protein
VTASIAPLPWLAAILAGATICGCGEPHASAQRTTLSHRAGLARAGRGISLRVASVTRLPERIQLPAVADDAGGALAIGGLNAQDGSVASIVRIDSGGAHRVGSLPVSLHDAAAASVDGHTYLFGGGNAGSANAVIMRVQGAGARAVGGLPVGASDVAAATIGHTAYIVGGFTETVALRTILAYTPPSGVRVVARLPLPLRYAAVAAVGGRLLIAGGTAGTSAQRAILSFDPTSAVVRRIGALAHPLTHAAGASLNGIFYVIGGRGESLTAQSSAILAINPSSGKVSTAGHLPRALSDIGGASLPGRILLVGGRDSSGRAQDRALTLVSSP